MTCELFIAMLNCIATMIRTVIAVLSYLNQDKK